MSLIINFSDFLKIGGIIKVKNLSAEISEYEITNEEINGKLGLSGAYYKDNLEGIHPINQEIDFCIIIKENDELEDIDCETLEYEVIEGRGIEVKFDIKLELKEKKDEIVEEIETKEETEEIELKEEIKENKEETSDSKEKLKEQIENEITKRLENVLYEKDDNLPQESFLDDLVDEKRNLCVVYFNSEKELEDVCKKKCIPLNKVFLENKDKNISKAKRIFINEES